MKRRIVTVVVVMMILSIMIQVVGCSKADSQTGNTLTTDTSLTETTAPANTPIPTPSPMPVPRLVEKVSFVDPELYPEYRDQPEYSEKKPSFRELYDEYGRIIELQDNRRTVNGGKTIVYKYDDDGKLSQTYTSKNESIVARSNYKYSEDGLLIEEDNENVHAIYSYDSDGRLTETKYIYISSNSNEPIDIATTEYTYNDAGLLSVEENTRIYEGYKVLSDWDESSFVPARHHEHAKQLEKLGCSYYWCFDYVIEYTYNKGELVTVKSNCDYGDKNRDTTLLFENGILMKEFRQIKGSYDQNCTKTYEYNDEGLLIKEQYDEEDTVNSQIFKQSFCFQYEYNDNNLVDSQTTYWSDDGSDEINYSSPTHRVIYRYYYE